MSASPSGYTAQLVDDGGKLASVEDQFFRSSAFLEAEGVTHSLLIQSESGSLLAPVLVREIEGGGIDASSPYGYPGFGHSGEPAGLPLITEAIDFSDTGLVSAFIRHSLAEPPLAGARPRNLCLLADPSLEAKSRMSDRQQIRKNERRGYSIEVTPGPETAPDLREAFLTAYTQTMDRTGAAERYYFSASYFDSVFSSTKSWLMVAREGEGEVAAASIAVVSDGLLHYYLSGTVDDFLGDSPMKNLLAGMIEFAGEMALPLNLGGGITPGDRLEEFKRGFANREERWFTSELVCDPSAYVALCASTGADPDGEFFPAYRA